jgi:hypothetical protein
MDVVHTPSAGLAREGVTSDAHRTARSNGNASVVRLQTA